MISSLLLLACLQVRYTTAAPSAPIIQQAEALAAEDRLQAIRLLEDYLQDGEDPELQRVVRTYAGEYRRLSGDMPGARLHFEALQDGESRAPSTQAAAL